jgi:hypothetical protein
MRARTFMTAVLLVGMLLATGTDAAAQRLTPHFPAWERYFTVTSEAFERRGQPHVDGYVVSHYGARAWRVQLLVESLDASGQVVAQRVEWLGGDVPPFSRTYFDVPAPERASAYRVSVFAFDFLQAALTEAP